MNSLKIHQNQPIAPWKKILRTNFTQVEKLLSYLELDEETKGKVLNKPSFSLNLPIRLAEKIQKNNLNDPILKQFLPTLDETIITSGFVTDPVGDSNCRSAPKMLHKYEGRVLLVTTSACAMHCRYCFRQNFDYETSSGFLFVDELKLIEKDESIHEVILSGGDPLSLSNEVLQNLIQQLEKMPHVRRLRFHTRFPVGIPERIDYDLLKLFDNCHMQIWFVLHINHPNELDVEIFAKLKQVQKTGAIVLNQSVLLNGINDDIDTLVKLSEMLVDRGILPYYLHQLDKVQGACHFEVSEEKGRQLIKEISKKLPGYGVPKYVREIEGKPNKVNL
jgi:EF-P beta-lysylation protein EpmB